MSARIDEHNESDAKPWTTKEVEKWQFVLGPTMPLRRSLATTRALEKAERERDELVAALNAVLLSWDASDDGMVHVDAIDAARVALAKAKGVLP